MSEILDNIDFWKWQELVKAADDIAVQKMGRQDVLVVRSAVDGKTEEVYLQIHGIKTKTKMRYIRIINLFGDNKKHPIVEYQEQYRHKLKKEDYDFARHIFLVDADFKDATFEGDADFKDATFEGDAIFWDAIFEGKADFNGTTFKEMIVFWGTTFGGEAYFRNVTFERKADFIGTTFGGEAYFRNVTFERKADFIGTTFERKADFNRTAFKGEADFEDATFKKEADFEDATFEEKANFRVVTFKGDANFMMATFKNVADFWNAKIKESITFERARIENEFNFLIDTESSKNCTLILKNTAINSRDLRVPDDLAQVLSKDTPRKTFVYLKDAALARHDTITALEYHKREYEAHKRELLLNNGWVFLLNAVWLFGAIYLFYLFGDWLFPDVIFSHVTWRLIAGILVVLFIGFRIWQYVQKCMQRAKEVIAKKKEAHNKKKDDKSKPQEMSAKDIFSIYLKELTNPLLKPKWKPKLSEIVDYTILSFERLVSYYGTSPARAIMAWLVTLIVFAGLIVWQYVAPLEVVHSWQDFIKIFSEEHLTCQKVLRYAFNPLSIMSGTDFLDGVRWWWVLEILNFIKTILLAYITYQITKSFRKFSRKF